MIVGTPVEIKNHEYRVGITPNGVRALRATGHRVLVQAGAGARVGFADAAYAEAGLPAQVDEFIDDMAAAYGWADLVVCRSGALTVAELAAVGIGALLVPFPHAVDDHQTRNAEFLAAAGAARLLPEPQCTPVRLATELTVLLGGRETLLQMAQAARGLAVPDAAERVATLCMAYLH